MCMRGVLACLYLCASSFAIVSAILLPVMQVCPSGGVLRIDVVCDNEVVYEFVYVHLGGLKGFDGDEDGVDFCS